MDSKLGPFEFNRVHLADMREAMLQIPDGSVHCIFTDPPYGISYQTDDLASCIEQALGHAAPANQPERSIANDDYGSFADVVVVMLDQAARVLTKDAAVCCCCCGGGGPRPVFADVAKWMDARLVFDQAVVWDKGGITDSGRSKGGGLGWRYRRNYEFVMISHRKGGKMRWFDQSAAISNVVRVPRIIPRAEDHSTPKPVELVETFLRLHTQEGDIVVDPFSGGGSTAEACIRLKRRFVGFEIDPKWVEYSNKRIVATIEKMGRISADNAEPGQQVGMYTGPGLLPPSLSKTQTKMDFDSVPPEPATTTPEVPAAPATSDSSS